MIFISYRRADSEIVVGNLCRELRKRFPGEEVFLDHDGIPLGRDFRAVIRERLKNSRIALVLIGPQWCDIVGRDGRRRLDDPEDNVRLEVEYALSTPGLDVIPLWVMRATTPEEQVATLPPSLQPLFKNNGMQVRPVPDEENDIERLVKRLSHQTAPRPQADFSATAELLLQSFLGTLSGREARAEVEQRWQILANQSNLPRDVTDPLLERVLRNLSTTPAAPATLPAPRLHVDLGHQFRVGHAMSVELHLICPGYTERPRVKACMRGSLDLTHWVEFPELRQEESGYWTFTEAFSLKNPHDLSRPCDPGSYRMELEVTFPSAPPGSLGRFLRGGLRIQVPDPNSAASRTLEIDGEGLSIIDFQNVPNLTEFSRVVIKGSDKSIINFGESAPAAAPTQVTAENRYFQLPIKRNLEGVVDKDEVWVSTVIHRPPPPQTAITLSFDGGGRYLIFAKERLQFGRQRNAANDVVLRFIPGSNRGHDEQHLQHEKQGEAISRKHFELALTREGLTVTDLGSSQGTRFADRALTPDVPCAIPVTEPPTAEELHVAEVFRLLLTQYTTQPPTAQSAAVNPPGDKHVVAIGGTTPPSWRKAGLSRLEAARITRVTNLPSENYVMLFRQASIGFGPECVLPTRHDDGLDVLVRLFHAGGCFWIERLVDQRDCPIQVNGHVPQRRELVPLDAGQHWTFGRSSCVVETAVQDLIGY